MFLTWVQHADCSRCVMWLKFLVNFWNEIQTVGRVVLQHFSFCRLLTGVFNVGLEYAGYLVERLNGCFFKKRVWQGNFPIKAFYSRHGIQMSWYTLCCYPEEGVAAVTRPPLLLLPFPLLSTLPLLFLHFSALNIPIFKLHPQPTMNTFKRS